MRASDDLRERTVARLGAGYAEGHLGFDTLCRRIDIAYGARSVEQLRALVRDLPTPAGALARLRELLGARDAAPGAALLSPPAATAGFALVIGRGRECDFEVADLTVSRRHAALSYEEKGWAVEDLGSRNGTFVNGWRVRGRGAVRPGDAVALGAAGWVFAPRS